MFDMCGAKLKGRRGVYCQNNSMQNLLSCTHSTILQAVSAVHLTVVLCGVIYISS